MSIILQGFCWRGGHVDILFKFVKVCAADGISFVYIYFLNNFKYALSTAS